VLVTGASGVVAFPVAAELAKNNDVYAVARFSDPHQQELLDQAGAHTIAFDLAEPGSVAAARVGGRGDQLRGPAADP
jgi:nucleoside-diphosphate-sugar epimerase